VTSGLKVGQCYRVAECPGGQMSYLGIVIHQLIAVYGTVNVGRQRVVDRERASSELGTIY